MSHTQLAGSMASLTNDGRLVPIDVAGKRAPSSRAHRNVGDLAVHTVVSRPDALRPNATLIGRASAC